MVLVVSDGDGGRHALGSGRHLCLIMVIVACVVIGISRMRGYVLRLW